MKLAAAIMTQLPNPTQAPTPGPEPGHRATGTPAAQQGSMPKLKRQQSDASGDVIVAVENPLLQQ